MPLTQPSVMLYDRECRIVFCSHTVQPYNQGSVIGTFAWAHVVERDRLRLESQLLRVIAHRTPQVNDSEVIGIGRWRTWLFPADIPDVPIISLARKIPAKTLLLTDRQREVCRALCDHTGSKAVAAALGVARSTVDNHRVQIAFKLDIAPGSLEAWCGMHRFWLD